MERKYSLRKRVQKDDKHIANKLESKSITKKKKRKSLTQRQLEKLRKKFLPLEESINAWADPSKKQNFL